jgi:hypothetical protein
MADGGRRAVCGDLGLFDHEARGALGSSQDEGGVKGMMAQRSNLTDRAKRYRAQNAVRGEHRCVLCNARDRLDVMHLDGNESNGEAQNLAHGCRSCNGKLAAAFKRIGAGVPTNQYNPSKGEIPTFGQYCWAVSQQLHSGAHGEAGAMIHATPKSKRIEYARRIADLKASRHNIWPFGEGQALGSRVYHGRARGAAKRAAPKLAAKAEAKARREQESERMERKLSDRELHAKLARHYAGGGNLAEYLQANPAAARAWNQRNRAQPHSALGDRLDSIDRQILYATDLKKRVALLKERDQLWHEAMGNAGEGRRNVDPLTASFLGDQLTKLGKKLADKRGKNPASAAASMYEKFHGRPSGEVVEVKKDLHYHGNLAALGELEKLTVKANDGGPVDLEGFGDAVLCSNERGTQLYIEGGDQAVKLSAFGIGKPYHDVEDLGEVVKLWYFTTKDHLGDQGGEASYHHTLSEEKKTRMSYGFGEKRAPKPRLLYDVLNQGLAFAGGEYSVEPEGIRN